MLRFALLISLFTTIPAGAIQNPSTHVFESNQFWETGTHPIRSTSESFRVESFGQSKFKFSVSGFSHPVFQHEGPYSYQESDSIAPCSPESHDLTLDGNDVAQTFEFSKPGVYRVTVSEGKACENQKLRPEQINIRPSTKNAASLEIQCLEGCHRPEISHLELLELLRKNGELDQLADTLEKQIDHMLEANRSSAKNTNPTDVAKQKTKSYFWHAIWHAQMKLLINGARLGFEFNRNKIDNHLKKFLDQNPMLAADRFPTVNNSFLTVVRHIAEVYKIPQNIEAPIQNEDLADLIKNGKQVRSQTQTVPKAPDLQFGFYADGALSNEATVQSDVLARVFNALSNSNPERPEANKISTLKYHGAIYSDVKSFIQKLINEGHVITVRNERTYGDFFHLSSHDHFVRWPVWVDTGIQLNSGKQLTVPLGHSQYSFTIHGPTVNARIAFFMGPQGAIFQPETHTYASWSGLRSISEFGSDKSPDAVFLAFDTAGKLLRRNHIEANEGGKFTMNGYGIAGVCNDSTSVIESVLTKWATGNPVESEYPLARSILMNHYPRLNDGLDDVFADLPKDLTPNLIHKKDSRQHLLYRIYQMLPFGYGDTDHKDETVANPETSNVIDSGLAEEMEEVRDELRQAGYNL